MVDADCELLRSVAVLAGVEVQPQRHRLQLGPARHVRGLPRTRTRRDASGIVLTLEAAANRIRSAAIRPHKRAAIGRVAGRLHTVGTGIREGSRDVDAAVACLTLRSRRIGGASNAVHHNAVRQRRIDGAHQSRRSRDHSGRSRGAAPRHVTVILISPQNIHARTGHKNRTAVVACRGQVVILIGGGNADDSFVAGRESRCVAAVVSYGGDQHDILAPGVVHRILQALAETRIAESHEDNRCPVVRRPHDSRDNVAVLTEAVSIQNLDRHDLHMVVGYARDALKIVGAGRDDAGEPCSMAVGIRESVGVVDDRCARSDRSDQIRMAGVHACIQYRDVGQKLRVGRAIDLVPCDLGKRPLTGVVRVRRRALPFSRQALFNPQNRCVTFEAFRNRVESVRRYFHDPQIQFWNRTLRCAARPAHYCLRLSLCQALRHLDDQGFRFWLLLQQRDWDCPNRQNGGNDHECGERNIGKKSWRGCHGKSPAMVWGTGDDQAQTLRKGGCVNVTQHRSQSHELSF